MLNTERYPNNLCVRVPNGLPKAIQAAAAKNATNPSEWTRQVLLKALRREGLRLRASRSGIELVEA